MCMLDFEEMSARSAWRVKCIFARSGLTYHSDCDFSTHLYVVAICSMANGEQLQTASLLGTDIYGGDYSHSKSDLVIL